MQKNIDRQWNAAIYARLSREDSDCSDRSSRIESDSIINQRELIKEYLKSKPEIRIVSERADDGFSGVSFDRPALNAMLDDIKTGIIDCIVVKDLSRFGRNYIEVGRYIRTLFPLLGVRFIAINDGYDSLEEKSIANDYIIPFKNIINDIYCADISKKIRSQLEIKRKKGDFIGSFVPFGYLKSPENKNKLIVDVIAAEVVKKIFKYKTAGMNYQGIADKLNSLGIPSPLEYKQSMGLSCSAALKINPMTKWSANAVQRILHNEIYTGALIQGKTTTPNYKIKQKITKDKSEWVRVENAHEAIISKKDFALVADLLSRDTRSAPSKETVYPFSGMILCPKCGRGMVRKVTRGKNTSSYCFYVCTRTYTTDKREGCAGIRIKESKLFKSVTLALESHIKIILDTERILRFIGGLPDKKDGVWKLKNQADLKKADIERSETRKARLYDDFSDNIITREEYDIFKNNYDLQIGEAKAALENLQKEIDGLSLSARKTNEAYLWLPQNDRWTLPVELSRELVVNFIDKIIVYNNRRIKIIFRYKHELSTV